MRPFISLLRKELELVLGCGVVLDLVGEEIALRLAHADDIVRGSWLQEHRIVRNTLHSITVYVHPGAELASVEISK